MTDRSKMNIYRELLETLKTEDRAAIVTTIKNGRVTGKELVTDSAFFEDAPQLVREAFDRGRPAVREDGDTMTLAEPFCRNERMIILGGGHVSLALAEFAERIGFSVIVADDRPAFASRERFPRASQVICGPYADVIRELSVNSTDYVILVTRGHQHDGDCLRALSKEKHTRYLGMMGSRRRVTGLKDLLAGEGIDRAWLDSVHTPIGLSIGAVTPEEIGISILAEVIRVKRMPEENAENRQLRSDAELEVIEKLVRRPAFRRKQKYAVVTILETRGSTPRKAGAKMILYEDGHAEGTVGGGSAEAELTEQAMEVMRTGGCRIVPVSMFNEVAGDAGMVCGGSAKILVEAMEPEE